jgi:protein-S-isoprenylcysteine O-methyltransferase Ste14
MGDGDMSPVARRFAQVGLGIVACALILFGAAGRLDWAWAWVYVGVSVAIVLVTALFLVPRHRDLIAERAGGGEGVKTWDKWLGGTASLLASFLALLVAGLDARLGWTRELPLRSHLVGLACFLAGYGLFLFAMAANRFFSTFVRIQKDRGHTVVDTGPYRAVRHPGYVGWIVSALATPWLLGSLWALVPAALGAALMVVRAALEDRTLRRELEGYEDYAARVRYRLLPGVW